MLPKMLDPFKVLTISSNKDMLKLIKKSLKTEEKYQFIDPSEIGDDLIESIEVLKPELLLLDYSYEQVNSLDLVESLSMQFPSIVVIIILRQESISEANRAIMLGARAFIVEPFDHDQLLDTLNKISDTYQRTKHGKQGGKIGKDASTETQGIFTVFSPKGGAGCSTVAINTAIAVKNKTGADVALIDGKLFFGDIDIMLNLKSQNSIAELIAHLGAMDESLINDVLSEHVTGIKVLHSPTSAIVSQGIHPQELHSVLVGMKKVFPYIFIDAGNYLYDNSVTMMDVSDYILLVIHPEMTSLRNASKFLEICESSLSIPNEKILLIINQYNQREGLKVKDIEDSLQIKPFVEIPAYTSTVLKSINKGTPILLDHKKSPLTRAYTRLADSLIRLSLTKQNKQS
jgi:pilus assembly protein CpaE